MPISKTSPSPLPSLLDFLRGIHPTTGNKPFPLTPPIPQPRGPSPLFGLQPMVSKQPFPSQPGKGIIPDFPPVPPTKEPKQPGIPPAPPGEDKPTLGTDLEDDPQKPPTVPPGMSARWGVKRREPVWGSETVIGPDGKPVSKPAIIGYMDIYGWIVEPIGGFEQKERGFEEERRQWEEEQKRLQGQWEAQFGLSEQRFKSEQQGQKMQWLMALLAIWQQLPLSQRPVLMAILKEWGIDITDILERLGSLGNIPALQGEARIAPGTVGR